MEKEEKEILFGVIENRVFEPNMAILGGSFTYPDTVIWGFCTHCGTYHEFSKGTAEKLFAVDNELLENLQDKYILLGACNQCLHTDNKFQILNKNSA